MYPSENVEKEKRIYNTLNRTIVLTTHLWLVFTPSENPQAPSQINTNLFLELTRKSTVLILYPSENVEKEKRIYSTLNRIIVLITHLWLVFTPSENPQAPSEINTNLFLEVTRKSILLIPYPSENVEREKRIYNTLNRTIVLTTHLWLVFTPSENPQAIASPSEDLIYRGEGIKYNKRETSYSRSYLG